MKIMLAVLLGLVLTASQALAVWDDGAEWDDQFYRYRIPFEINAASTGTQILSISSDDIVTAINQLEDIHHSAKYFDYNNIKIVKYDDSGNIIDTVDTGGYFWSEASGSGEFIYNGSFETSNTTLSGWSYSLTTVFKVGVGMGRDGSNCLWVETDVKDRARMRQGSFHFDAGKFYLLSYWSKALQNTYNLSVNISDILDSWSSLRASYIPSLYSKYWTQYFQLFSEDTGKDVQINLERMLTGEAFLDDVSLKEINIDLLLDVAATGPGNYMLYYQPSQMLKRFMPEKSIPLRPAQSVTPTLVGPAQRYDSISQYKVLSVAESDVWFADTTRKLTPMAAAPSNTKPGISISAAKNERQSFQLVYKAKSNVNLTGVSLGSLTSGSDTIPAAKSYTKIIEYVDMASQSPSAVNYVPRMGDPLIPFETRALTTASENLGLWFTVIVDSTVEAGDYTGNITLEGDAGGTPFTHNVPLTLKVHQFTLPDRPSFRTSHGGSHFAVKYDGTGLNVYEFHGVSSDGDKQTLVRNYFDVMCQNKVFPAGVAYGHGYTFSWTPPAYGYNIDQPGNFFTLIWDADAFDDYNAEMQYYRDNYHVNSFIIAHTNGDLINRFNLGNFYVAWDWPDTSVQPITQNQYKGLIQDYYREVAINLMFQGWLDYAYISIDESTVASYPKIRFFIDALAEDYFTSMLKIQWDIDKTSPFTWKEFPDTETEVTMKNRVDIWTPENNEGYNFNHDYYWTEHNMDPAQEEIWCYYTRSSHMDIDAQGLSNRIFPVKNFYMNSTGYLNWASFIYEKPAVSLVNPWIDPYSPWGNGAVAYFYPPSAGVAPSPDFTITPSARLETFREGVEDFEYMKILDDWIDTAAASGIDTSNAVALQNEMFRMVPHPVRWSTNDDYYLSLRASIAGEIETLMWYSTYGMPTTDLSKIERTGNDIQITLYAKEIYRYNLLRSYQLADPSWVVVDTVHVNSSDTITLTDPSLGSLQKAFYKVQAVKP